MEIHHLGLGAMRPYGGALFDGRTPGLGPSDLVCHCLLLETSVGPVLIDTGVAGADPEATAARIDPFFRVTDRVRLRPEDSAAHKVRALGHAPGDVRHIVMTHLDFDHAAGLPDFPAATVHVAEKEANAARFPVGPKERARYRTAAADDTARWHAYDAMPANFFGLSATTIDGVSGLMLVALPGHTRGHCGVAIDLGRGKWLLHAGDAIFNARELDRDWPSMPTGARLYQWFMETSQVERRRSLAQLRRLHRNHADHVDIICTHDPAILARSAAGHTDPPRSAPGSGG